MSQTYVDPLANLQLLSVMPQRPKARLLSGFGKISLLAIVAVVVMAVGAQYAYEGRAFFKAAYARTVPLPSPH